MKYRLILLILILINFGFRLWAIDRGSLWDIRYDEAARVTRAVHIVSTGDLNHGYFNHPSSTVIYPLAAVYFIWGIIAYKGPLLGANPFLDTAFRLNSGEFYLLGRYFTIAFTTATIPLVYLLGRRLFNKTVGMIGAMFWIILPGIVYYSQVVRDDLVAAFFTLLSLWLCLKLLDQPSTWGQIRAGLAIGLAIATRYLMAPLALILLIVDALLWLQAKPPAYRKHLLLPMSSGLLSIILAFALSTPYFFLDLEEVQDDLLYESRTTHSGADSLSPLENFSWYLTYAIPENVTWSLTLLALVGLAPIILSPTGKEVLVMGFGVIFLGIISLHPLHWPRWIIPLLPILALLAGKGLSFLTSKLSIGLRLRPAHQSLILVFAVYGLSINPIITLGQQLSYQSIPSTRALARKWLLQNVPEGTGIVLESGTALMEDNFFPSWTFPALARADYTIDQAYTLGVRYIVINMGTYERYRAKATLYQNELALYRTLFDKAVLLQEIKPSPNLKGPPIRIYELP